MLSVNSSIALKIKSNFLNSYLAQIFFRWKGNFREFGVANWISSQDYSFLVYEWTTGFEGDAMAFLEPWSYQLTNDAKICNISLTIVFFTVASIVHGSKSQVLHFFSFICLQFGDRQWKLGQAKSYTTRFKTIAHDRSWLGGCIPSLLASCWWTKTKQAVTPKSCWANTWNHGQFIEPHACRTENCWPWLVCVEERLQLTGLG